MLERLVLKPPILYYKILSQEQIHFNYKCISWRCIIPLSQPQLVTFKKKKTDPPAQDLTPFLTATDCHIPAFILHFKNQKTPPKEEPHCPPSAPTVIFLTATIFLTTQPPQNIKQCSDPKSPFNPSLLMPIQKPSLLVSANILWLSRPPSPTPLHFQAFPNGCLKESP